MKSEITAVARGGKCGAFGAYGFTPAAGAAADVGRRGGGEHAVAFEQPGQRQPADSAARLEQEVASIPEVPAAAMRHGSPQVEELVQVEEHVRERRERLRARPGRGRCRARPAAGGRASAMRYAQIDLRAGLAGLARSTRPPAGPPAPARTGCSAASAPGSARWRRCGRRRPRSCRGDRRCRTSGTATSGAGRRRRRAATPAGPSGVFTHLPRNWPARMSLGMNGKIGSPPTARLMLPPAVSMLSRTISASRRCGRKRHR